MSAFYPGLYATFMFFLPLHQAVSLLQTKSLAQTVFLKYTADGDWAASQKQPRRHLVVTRLRQFWSRRQIRNFWGSSPSTANLLNHAVIDILLIHNYRQLQTTIGTEITTNQGEPFIQGGLDSSRVKRNYFYKRSIPKYMMNYLPLMGTKAGLDLIKAVQEQSGLAFSSTGAATEWHCSQRPVCPAGSSQHQILV